MRKLRQGSCRPRLPDRGAKDRQEGDEGSGEEEQGQMNALTDVYSRGAYMPQDLARTKQHMWHCCLAIRYDSLLAHSCECSMP